MKLGGTLAFKTADLVIEGRAKSGQTFADTASGWAVYLKSGGRQNGQEPLGKVFAEVGQMDASIIIGIVTLIDVDGIA